MHKSTSCSNSCNHLFSMSLITGVSLIVRVKFKPKHKNDQKNPPKTWSYWKTLAMSVNNNVVPSRYGGVQQTSRSIHVNGDFSSVLPQSYTRQSQLKLGSGGFWGNMRLICSECVTRLNHQPRTAVLVVRYIHCSYGIEVISLGTLNSLVLRLHGRSSLWMCIDSTLMLLHSIRKIPCGELKSDCVIWFLFPSKCFESFYTMFNISSFPVDKKFALKKLIMCNFFSPSQCCQLQKWMALISSETRFLYLFAEEWKVHF